MGSGSGDPEVQFLEPLLRVKPGHLGRDLRDSRLRAPRYVQEETRTQGEEMLCPESQS